MPVEPATIRGRYETDLEDGELTALIADAEGEIRRRYGPDRSTAEPPVPVTTTVTGGGRTLDFPRAIDTVEEVVELTDSGFVSAGGEVTLAATDYELANGGQTLKRLGSGDNPPSLYPSDRGARWGREVRVSYMPVDDQAQRDEVVIKLVALSMEYDPVASRRVGDTAEVHTAGAASGGLIYEDEREKLLASLSPRRGLLLA